jgi:hypothetical protein
MTLAIFEKTSESGIASRVGLHFASHRDREINKFNGTSTTLRSSCGSKTSEIPGGIPMKGYEMSLIKSNQ